jgi:hypothetical protein
MREHLLYIGGGWRAGRGGTAESTSPSSGKTSRVGPRGRP